MNSTKLYFFVVLTAICFNAVAQLNPLVSLPKLGAYMAIDDANNRLIVASVQIKPRLGLNMFEQTTLHLFDLSNNQLVQNLELDSAFLGFVPFHIQSFVHEILVFGYADLGRDTFSQQANHQYGNLMTILRINLPSYNIDTLTLQFPHNIHTSYPVKTAQGWLLLSSLKAPHPNFPSPSELLNARYLNNQLQVVKDTSLFQRYGLDARGAMFQFGQLTDSLIYVLCGGCKMHITNTAPPFRKGEHDVAIYDLELNLKSNEVFLASSQTPNWPFANNQTITGPGTVAGVIAVGANTFVQLADYTNANQTPVHGFWPDGTKELYFTKFNRFGQVLNRHYYGNVGIADNLNYTYNQLAQGGNGRIYALSTTNSAAPIFFPDSIQSLFVHSVDTQLTNPFSSRWHNGADVYGQQIKATSSGVYVFANSVSRGGEKFHVLRIEGTAWASSSSQQVWPEWGVFPNPARERVFISGELPSNISLHDMQGRLLHQWSALENNELQLPALPPGIYLLHGSNAQGKRWPVRKLVVR